MTKVANKTNKLTNDQKLRIYLGDREGFWKANHTLNVSLVVNIINSLSKDDIPEFFNIIKKTGNKFFESSRVKKAFSNVLKKYDWACFKSSLYIRFRNIVGEDDEELLKNFVNFVIGDINIAKSWFTFISDCESSQKYFHIIAKYIHKEDISDKTQFELKNNPKNLLNFLSYYFNKYTNQMNIELYTIGFINTISNAYYSRSSLYYEENKSLTEILSITNSEKKYDLVDTLFNTYINIIDDSTIIPENAVAMENMLLKFSSFIGNEACPDLNKYYLEVLDQKRNELKEFEQLWNKK